MQFHKPKEFDFVHQTVSHWEVCTGWARDKLHCYVFVTSGCNSNCVNQSEGKILQFDRMGTVYTIDLYLL